MADGTDPGTAGSEESHPEDHEFEDSEIDAPQPGFTEEPDKQARNAALRQVEITRLTAQADYHRALSEQVAAQTAYLKTEADIKEDDKAARGKFMVAVGIAALVQLVISNAVFITYAWYGRHWNVPVQAISVWLGATMVQIVAVLTVVATNLFPRRDNPKMPESLLRSTPISTHPDSSAPPTA